LAFVMRRWLALGAASLAQLLAVAACAAQWQVEPQLRVTQTLSDNVALAPAGLEQGDLVTEVTPHITIRGRGPRVEARLEYTLETFTYLRNRDYNRHDHLLVADGRAELVPRLLFVDARADRSRKAANALGQQEIDGSLASSNRTVTDTYSVSPFVRRSHGSAFNYEARYVRDHVGFDDQRLTDSDGDSLLASVRSGPAFSRLAWGVQYLDERVRYEDAQRTSRRAASVDLGLELAASVAVLAGAGHEDNEYPFVGSAPEGPFWSAGIKWEPSRLTRLELRGGRRFFGTTRLADLTHRSRYVLWSLRYSEDLSSSRAQLLLPSATTATYLDRLGRIETPEPLARGRAVDEFMTQRGLPARVFGAIEVFGREPYVEKRLDASVTLKTPRTTAILSVFRSDRDARLAHSDPNGFLAAGSITRSPNVLQKGVGALANWRFAPRTQLQLDLGYNDASEADTGLATTTRFVRLGLRHELSRKATASLDYRHVTGDTATSGRYRENAIAAGVRIRF
jgi:uncharacterized protein (PEP-CTERM system associated)